MSARVTSGVFVIKTTGTYPFCPSLLSERASAVSNAATEINADLTETITNNNV